MNNEMKFEKNGLLIPNGALEELGLAGISLSAWLGQDHILLMPQEMTAEQLLHALDGLSQAWHETTSGYCCGLDGKARSADFG